MLPTDDWAELWGARNGVYNHSNTSFDVGCLECFGAEDTFVAATIVRVYDNTVSKITRNHESSRSVSQGNLIISSTLVFILLGAFCGSIFQTAVNIVLPSQLTVETFLEAPLASVQQLLKTDFTVHATVGVRGQLLEPHAIPDKPTAARHTVTMEDVNYYPSSEETK
ncbi:hypothetical protein BV898_11111 [Hypsibius exemplaris]|uniref:Uncharacterized protein n=1 Tax=Hypsibius exemplaris TaxID=2072580 RepID=A0A1W0WHS0_HYPEX|nr:hypothetical protein BV898_11111 [Hypsibius exemplaris]